MERIVIASNNPVKIQAVRNGFSRIFPDLNFQVDTVLVQSGVSDQPMTDAETMQGAVNRAKNARGERPDADYWVGIEGGIEPHHEEMAAFAWIVVISRTMMGKGRTGTFYLPKSVVDLILEGKELGEADDIVFNRVDSKRESGAIGILTGGVVDRAKLYEHGVLMALVAFKNPQLY